MISEYWMFGEFYVNVECEWNWVESLSEFMVNKLWVFDECIENEKKYIFF